MYNKRSRIDTISTLFGMHPHKGQMNKKNQGIMAALQYKPLYNISRSEKWGKKIQAVAYNGARTVCGTLNLKWQKK